MKQQKSREGLTLNGIAFHIANSILLWEKGVPQNNKYGTRNDCQLVINRLIRDYHDRLEAEGHIPATTYSPKAIKAKRDGKKLVKEHAIPVACVMRELIDRQCKTASGDIDVLVHKVHEILRASSNRRYISKDENKALKGYEDKMPDGHECYPWKNVWVRHVKAGIL